MATLACMPREPTQDERSAKMARDERILRAQVEAITGRPVVLAPDVCASVAGDVLATEADLDAQAWDGAIIDLRRRAAARAGRPCSEVLAAVAERLARARVPLPS